MGHENKCPENVAIFKEIMVLRDEAARILGYPNHAAFRIENKMARTTETVDAFLADLKSRLTSGGRKELERLKQLKKTDMESRGERFDGRFFLWDYGFYRQMMLRKDYSVNHQRISEYFPLETTVRGMLSIFEHLFGLSFHEVNIEEGKSSIELGTDNGLVWHEGVQMFSVCDSKDEHEPFLGYLYMDLWSRDKKYSGPSNWNIQPVNYIHQTFLSQYTDVRRASFVRMEHVNTLPPHCFAASTSQRLRILVFFDMMN